MKPNKHSKKEMKEFGKTKQIYVPIYPFIVTFCLLNKEGEKFIENKHAYTDARTEKDGQKIFIYLRKNAEWPTVVHELFHATEFIMLDVGQKTDTPPNEAWAYLIQWITEEYIKFTK